MRARAASNVQQARCLCWVNAARSSAPYETSGNQPTERESEASAACVLFLVLRDAIEQVVTSHDEITAVHRTACALDAQASNSTCFSSFLTLRFATTAGVVRQTRVVAPMAANATPTRCAEQAHRSFPQNQRRSGTRPEPDLHGNDIR